MIIPKKIYDVLNSKRNFDFIFLEKLKTLGSEDAYDAAVAEVRKYAPKFKHYKDFDSYRQILHGQSTKEVDVPMEIIEAVTAGIDNLFHKHLQKVKVRKLAYDLVIIDINRHFPDYKPYRNYQSFKVCQSIIHKKRTLKVKKTTK
jgi:hypothetical protein